METIARKGPGRQGKAVADVEPVVETQDNAGIVTSDRETSNARLEASAQYRRARERRQIGILGHMMTGASFIIKR